ncbi:class I SAM-dependent methyltransferase [Sporosarcina sp. PTS2304]|uniref:class I SAM-dependent methyltransferase n=1 Tax=Sporosarcina sp. PTS2304 TaxID=2283194 RepID=UPI000E0DBC87|nr:class I SAM-dependent methyltransferase [Sporosarcina sp. PTS2304]AXI00482.1 class I SAM-dependent methyltransferase [Sporosarcina sp. PTS2304]
MDERAMDKNLHIKTAGVREWVHQLAHYNRYEATPYDGMDYLFDQHAVLKSGSFIDFGCGKGRVPFYVHSLFSVDTIGIEMSSVLFQDAMNNLLDYRQAFPKKKGMISFECMLAERFVIPSDAATFYFFNPFSVEVFRSVIRNIVSSLESSPRDAEVILYYPTTAYKLFLQSHPLFEKIAEIPITHLQIHDNNELFLVYAYKQP